MTDSGGWKILQCMKVALMDGVKELKEMKIVN
jgi:hypothetical protein